MMVRYAAVDIGSNSFRLAVAEATPRGGLNLIATDRQVTRLGAGVFSNGVIGKQAMADVVKTLTRFREIYQPLQVSAVRAVATSAVRDARNQAAFLAAASAAIGTTVEIISGLEEARLIHNGILSRWPQQGRRVLMIDIGGGSAEIIESHGGKLISAVSKPLGAVRLTEMFLHHNPPMAGELERMEAFIDEKLDSLIPKIPVHYDRAIGTSGTAAATVRAVNQVKRAEREAADQAQASTAALGRLYRELGSMSEAQRRKVPGIGPRRSEIIVAGAAVFHRILKVFKVRSVSYSASGVRDGILFDLAERRAGIEFTRMSNEQRGGVEQMARRFSVNLPHARRVASVAHELFVGLRPMHELPAAAGRLIDAAAYLLDTGHAISATAHHKHSYYIVVNSDLAGFTNQERLMIALLCRFHRKSLPESRHEIFINQAEEVRETVWRLIPLLRLADGLVEPQSTVENVECAVRSGTITVTVDSTNDVQLEQWTAEMAAVIFKAVYGKRLVLERN